MHIFFSRQTQYKMLLLITVYPFRRWWVDNLKHSKENDFPKKLTFKATTQHVHGSEVGVQQIIETCFLFKLPMHVCVLYIWPFVAITNSAKCLLCCFTAWLFRGGYPWESKLSAGVRLQKLFTLLSMLPLTYGTTFLKLSLFLKQVQSSYSQHFFSAGAEKLWPRA